MFSRKCLAIICITQIFNRFDLRTKFEVDLDRELRETILRRIKSAKNLGWEQKLKVLMYNFNF